MIKRVCGWILVCILAACGQPEAPPVKATNFPDSIFMQPIDPLNAVEPDPYFEFSMKDENIFTGNLKELGFEIDVIHLELGKLTQTSDPPHTTIISKSYPVNFEGEGIEYRFSIDFIKNIQLNPQDMHFITIRGCTVNPNGEQNPCTQDSTLISINP